METGIRKTLEGYQAWFKVGNQTFHLDDCVEDNDEESLECAQFMERMLKVAFEGIGIEIKDKPKLEIKETICTLNINTCGKGSACKYPHCHL